MTSSEDIIDPFLYFLYFDLVSINFKKHFVSYTKAKIANRQIVCNLSRNSFENLD